MIDNHMFQLEGLFTNLFLSSKSHILDSNAVWYVLLILVEGVYKRPNLNNFGLPFCPQGFWLTAPHIGPRLAAPWDLDSIYGAASRGPGRC